MQRQRLRTHRTRLSDQLSRQNLPQRRPRVLLRIRWPIDLKDRGTVETIKHRPASGNLHQNPHRRDITVLGLSERQPPHQVKTLMLDRAPAVGWASVGEVVDVPLYRAVRIAHVPVAQAFGDYAVAQAGEVEG